MFVAQTIIHLRSRLRDLRSALEEWRFENNLRRKDFQFLEQGCQIARLHAVVFCVFAVQVSIPSMHSVKIITLDAAFSFDIAFLSLILNRNAVSPELCNNLEVATLTTLFRCFIVSEMIVVRVMSEFQCCRIFLETHRAGYVSLLKACPHFKDSA